MAQPAKFWDRIAERYAKQPVADEAAYQQKLDKTREYLRDDMEVLEIGCGTGSTAVAHAPYVRHIRAIDLSAKMIEIARSKADAQGVANVTFEQSPIDDCCVPEHSMDAVLALSVLHLLTSRDAAIAQIARMLKPGGVFVSSTACLGDHMGWFRLVAPVGKVLGLIPPVAVFTTQELLTSLTGGGFHIDYQWQPGKSAAVFIVAKKV